MTSWCNEIIKFLTVLENPINQWTIKRAQIVSLLQSSTPATQVHHSGDLNHHRSSKSLNHRGL